jgi:hypothetical protein
MWLADRSFIAFAIAVAISVFLSHPFTIRAAASSEAHAA